jgi:hypothetical protein
VKGFNAAGESLPSDVNGRLTRQQKPSSLAFNTVWSSSMTITWLSDDPVGTGFEIELSTEASFASVSNSTINVKSLSSQVTTGTITGLAPLTTYYAHVRTLSSADDIPPLPSDYGLVPGFARTGQPFIILDKPVITAINFEPLAADFDKLDIAWSTVTSAASYLVERSRTPTLGYATVAIVSSPTSARRTPDRFWPTPFTITASRP